MSSGMAYLLPHKEKHFFFSRLESKFQMLGTLRSLNPICLRTTWEDKAKG